MTTRLACAAKAGEACACALAGRSGRRFDRMEARLGVLAGEIAAIERPDGTKEHRRWLRRRDALKAAGYFVDTDGDPVLPNTKPC